MNEKTFLRHIYHPAVTRLAHWMAPAKVTPVQSSLMAFVIAIIAAWVFSSQFYAGLFFGALLTYLSITLHQAGEEIRRLNHLPPEQFRKIDKALTLYSELILIAGLCAHTVVDNSRILCLIIAILAAAGILLLDKIKDRPTKEFWKNVAWIEDPAFRILLIILGALFNIPLLILLAIAFSTNGLLIAGLLEQHESTKS